MNLLRTCYALTMNLLCTIPIGRVSPLQVQSRTLLFGLEQQRRPPLEGVWLIKEVSSK